MPTLRRNKMRRKTTRLDLHVHTPGSDGSGSPEQYVRAVLAAGIDGLVITDHHHTYTAGGLRVAQACRAAGLTVLHGCEYSTANNHCLIYGVDVDELGLGEYPPMQEVIDRVNAAGGVVVPSHPYKGYRLILGDDVYGLHGIAALEGVNGQAAFQNPVWNRQANKAAKKMRLQMTGGSDAHSLSDIPSCATHFERKISNVEELITELRAGRFSAVNLRQSA